MPPNNISIRSVRLSGHWTSGGSTKAAHGDRRRSHSWGRTAAAVSGVDRRIRPYLGKRRVRIDRGIESPAWLDGADDGRQLLGYGCVSLRAGVVVAPVGVRRRPQAGHLHQLDVGQASALRLHQPSVSGALLLQHDPDFYGQNCDFPSAR